MQINFNIPKDKHIVVYSNYRTGSTAFCDFLSKETGLVNHDEVFHSNIPFKKQHLTQSPSIFKIMPDHIVPAEFTDLVSNGFKIGIKRRSLVDQIASYYICHMTKIWHYKQDDILNNGMYNIEIVDTELVNVITYILELHDTYHTSGIQKDIEFYYEDVLDIFSGSKYIRYKKPDNYQILSQRIAGLLNSAKTV
jgi:LPS sulfotransferase NodH